MGSMSSPRGSHGRRPHGSLWIVALVAVTLASLLATTSDAGDDLSPHGRGFDPPSEAV